jgi:glycopeptide antibiotics resistance protein
MPLVIDTLKEYIAVGLLISSILFFLCMLIYLIVYKIIMHGKKMINYKKAIIFSIFITYIYLVLNTTLFANFRDLGISGINLELFNSYIKVLRRFSNSIVWRDIILNIFMFIPFGFLLPLLNKHFHKPYITWVLGLLFTLSIEITQLIIKVGAFDVDDIFNNFLGSIIGYFLVMSLLSSKFNKSKKKPKCFLLYFIPLTLITLSFLAYYIYCFLQ